MERLDAATVGRPDLMQGRTSLTLGEGMSGIMEAVFINVKNRSSAITAEIEVPQGGGNGTIIAQGRTDHTQAGIFSADETADVGIDLGTPVVAAVGSDKRSAFTGHIAKVVVEVLVSPTAAFNEPAGDSGSLANRVASHATAQADDRASTP